MKKHLLFALVIFSALNIWGQEKADLVKLAETENSFARAVDANGIKAGFLEYLADDGILFRPTAVNGKESWQARPATSAHLSWYLVFVDASADGFLGYTTGAGEFRPKGKSDSNVYYSEYMTVWQRQPNGEYKAKLDIGISHEKPATADKSWKSPERSDKNTAAIKSPASNSVNLFYDTATIKGLEKAYKIFASNNVRFLREGKFPIVGKSNALAEYKKSKAKITFGRNMTLQSAGNLAYAVTTYELKDQAKTIEKGNSVQIWKYTDDNWQIVMDVFAPIPER